MTDPPPSSGDETALEQGVVTDPTAANLHAEDLYEVHRVDAPPDDVQGVRETNFSSEDDQSLRETDTPAEAVEELHNAGAPAVNIEAVRKTSTPAEVDQEAHEPTIPAENIQPDKNIEEAQAVDTPTKDAQEIDRVTQAKRDADGAEDTTEGETEEDDHETEEEEEDDEDEDDDDEPRLKYARLTQHLGAVYRNADATSAFLVAGDKMVGFQFMCMPVRTMSLIYTTDHWNA